MDKKKKKIIFISVFAVGLATLIAGAVFLILNLTRGADVADGEYLVSVEKWVLSDSDRVEWKFTEIGKGTFNQPFMDIIKNAKDFIANYDAILAASNKMNSAVYCFRSKNFYRNERFRYSRGSFKSVRGCSKPDRG